jgi:hypothetical protein
MFFLCRFSVLKGNANTRVGTTCSKPLWIMGRSKVDTAPWCAHGGKRPPHENAKTGEHAILRARAGKLRRCTAYSKYDKAILTVTGDRRD